MGESSATKDNLVQHLESGLLLHQEAYQKPRSLVQCRAQRLRAGYKQLSWDVIRSTPMSRQSRPVWRRRPLSILSLVEEYKCSKARHEIQNSGIPFVKAAAATLASVRWYTNCICPRDIGTQRAMSKATLQKATISDSSSLKI